MRLLPYLLGLSALLAAGMLPRPAARPTPQRPLPAAPPREGAPEAWEQVVAAHRKQAQRAGRAWAREINAVRLLVAPGKGPAMINIVPLLALRGDDADPGEGGGGGAPTAPDSLTYEVVTGEPEPLNMLLSWSDNSSDETGFEVQRNDNGGGYTLLTDALSANTTGYTDHTIVSGNSYAYRVRALYSGGASAWSNEPSAVPVP